MPLDLEERDRLIALARSYADGAAVQLRLSVEDTGAGVLIRGARWNAAGREEVETLNISWELVERSSEPERFLQTQVWAVEHGLTQAAPRPRP
jgi:hypothetical protein